ncbi:MULTISPECIES: NAD(P)-dependent oxidoreductase [unclassified Paenibacillus]|uniref:NAD(P)-dependent oxidoreductase n=1 Tax=unclassified Paenibacillus TaxID=185978 RepID=UPI001AE4A29B|nr:MULTISPECIES: NAD(P)-dependent oxidoreductase [unclassified Paenibacillus]MBP1155861.1 3-hydroxyisobutyrate dehydrogenase [Paenibacillus sp. PvP091]MBP1168753.1 3-hydroxyisobutyrate dehydrogenase [Paenibacillus sp. PvR098]MBP2439781.1 3-hydroxyisobutyrate dehydrogenase [Paenibacillus sp. PvP052]
MRENQWRVGVIGLGNMGGNMAQAIFDGGYAVTVYDVNSELVSKYGSLGFGTSDSIQDLTQKSNLILTSLPNSEIVRQVYMGAQGIVQHIQPGSVAVDLSTIEPDVIREIDTAIVSKSASLLDAPVSGGPNEARNGELVLIVGGHKELLEEVEPVLRRIGNTIFHVGTPGDAKVVKLVNNMMTMGNVLVAAEAFSVGVKAGVDPELLFQVLSQSGGRSHHFNKRFPKALERNFNPGFTVELGEKDVGLGVDLSKSLQLPLPLMNLVRQMYGVAMSEGLGKEDIVSVLKLYENWGSKQKA